MASATGDDITTATGTTSGPLLQLPAGPGPRTAHGEATKRQKKSLDSHMALNLPVSYTSIPFWGFSRKIHFFEPIAFLFAPYGWIRRELSIFVKENLTNMFNNPKLDTRISVLRTLSFVTLRLPPLDSETGWTGELWSNCVFLVLENYDNSILFFFNWPKKGKKN